MIFDNTVINNKLGYNVELTRWQYSGNKHQVVCVLSAAKFVGLGIVNCVYFNRGMNNLGKSIYQVKHGLLSKDLTEKLKYPSIKMKVIWLEKLKVFWIKIVIGITDEQFKKLVGNGQILQ